MSLQSQLNSFVVRVAERFGGVEARTGALDRLKTDAKTDLVTAINELAERQIVRLVQALHDGIAERQERHGGDEQNGGRDRGIWIEHRPRRPPAANDCRKCERARHHGMCMPPSTSRSIPVM